MRIPLQAWYDTWIEVFPPEKRESVSLSQLHFVRDQLAPLLWADTLYDDVPREPPPRSDCPVTAWVIGEHVSKSRCLPVYSLERPDKGLQFVLRNNFFNWKLSVLSEVPIQHDLFRHLFHTTPAIEPDYTGDPLASCYFDGFPKDLIFGYQSENPRRWSAELHGDHALWTTILLCLAQVGIHAPVAWRTQAGQKARFAADAAARARRRAQEGH